MKLHWQMLVVAAVVLLGGQGRSDEKDFPKAEDLMDNYVKVTGGEAAHRKFKTRIAEGTMSTPLGDGPLKLYQKAPNSLYLETELPTIGTMQAGTDGKVAWESNKITGAKLKSGDSKEQSIREANFYSDVEWRKVYKTVKTVGEDKVNDAPCWKVELTTTSGKTTTRYFDKKTGYVVKMNVAIEDPTIGKVQTENFISDYKKVDGLIFPHVVKTTAAGTNLTITFTKVQHDVDIPEAKFAIPDAVKKLIEKEKQQ